MKFIHKIILSLLIIGTAFIMDGCNKNPLDQKPTGSYTTGNYWRNQNDVIAGVLGIYNILYTEDWVGHDLYAYADASDDIWVAGDHQDFKDISNFNIDAPKQLIYITWPFAYDQLARPNNAII